MEEKDYSPKTETVELVDGFLWIKRKLLKKCIVVKELLTITGRGLELKTDLYYTKKNFTLLFQCLEDSKLIKKVPSRNIVDIINIAGNLGFPIKLRRQLTKRALRLGVPFVIDKELGFNTVDELKMHDNIMLDTIYLFCNKLHSLQGIEAFASRDIAEISLRHNNLRSLDLTMLREYFPGLRKVNIGSNKLHSLNIGELPDYFILKAKNNKLTDLNSFVIGEGCTLNLQGNQFLQGDKIREFARKVSIIQRAKALYRHFLSNDQAWTENLIAAVLPTIIGSGVGMSIDLAKCFSTEPSSSHFCSPTFYDTYKYTLIGAFAGALIPPIWFIALYKKTYKILL